VRGLGALRSCGELVVQDTDADRAAAFAERHAAGAALGAEIASAADSSCWRPGPAHRCCPSRPREGQHSQPGRRRARLAGTRRRPARRALLVVDDRNWPRPWACWPRTPSTHARRRPARRPPGTRRAAEVPSTLPSAALQDLALARLAYERAERDGVGRRVICWGEQGRADRTPRARGFRRSGALSPSVRPRLFLIARIEEGVQK